MRTGPAELIDALLTEEWGRRFESFTDDEHQALAALDALCWKLGTRTFFKQPTSLHFGNGGTVARLPDDEAMEVAGVALRRTFVPHEPTDHARVVEILRRRLRPGPEGARINAVLDELERRFEAVLAEPLMHAVDQTDIIAGRYPKPLESFDARRVLSDWLGGVVLGGDPAKRADVERWSPVAYQWSVAKAMRGLWGVLVETHVVVRGALGVLDVDPRPGHFSASTTPTGADGSELIEPESENLVLNRPGEIYRPFTPAETGRLRAYVADVRRLGHMSFFQQVPNTARLAFEGSVLNGQMREPDDEALRAAITQFRQVYSHTEPTSFKPTFNLLKRSVNDRGGVLRDEAIRALDAHIESERRHASEGLGVGFVLDDGDQQSSVSVRDLLDAYFHGHYLHSANEKAELVARLDDMGPFARMTLYRTMLVLRNVFWKGANVVDRVLNTPELLDIDAPDP